MERTRTIGFGLEFVAPFAILLFAAALPLAAVASLERFMPGMAAEFAVHPVARYCVLYLVHTWAIFLAIVAAIVFVCGTMQAIALLRAHLASRRPHGAVA
jgi:hypothetical protein